MPRFALPPSRSVRRLSTALHVLWVVVASQLASRPLCGQEGPVFYVGSSKLDAGTGPGAVRVEPGARGEIALWYSAPSDLADLEAVSDIQGVSMVVCVDCRARVDESTFRLPDESIAGALAVDFVAFQSDDDPVDGDGCAFTVAILVDLLPPYDGATLPVTDRPLLLAAVDFTVDDDVECGDVLDLRFCDDEIVSGDFPLSNVVAAGNRSHPVVKVDGSIVVEERPRFIRGDCDADQRIDITDAIHVILVSVYQGGLGATAACEDACDVDDDGRVNIADTLRLLRWLFSDGAAPPTPGPRVAGIDPTADALVCPARCP